MKLARIRRMSYKYVSTFECVASAVNVAQIIGIHGVRNVSCDCVDGKHSSFERCRSYAFQDYEGNVVVKQSKAMLLPLN